MLPIAVFREGPDRPQDQDGPVAGVQALRRPERRELDHLLRQKLLRLRALRRKNIPEIRYLGQGIGLPGSFQLCSAAKLLQQGFRLKHTRGLVERIALPLDPNIPTKT